NIIN
ncbi:hypothetical protein D030_0648B, partial [Vibrio parahaemolyticus AQ3810]